MATVEDLQADLDLKLAIKEDLYTALQEVSDRYSAAAQTGTPSAELAAELDAAQEAWIEAGNAARDAYRDLQIAKASAEASPVTPSASEVLVDQSTAERYAETSNVPYDEFAGYDEAVAKQTAITKAETEAAEETARETNRLKNLYPGANNNPPAPAKAQWKEATDMRVTLRAPKAYLQGPTAPLSKIGGIIFPYTPSISFDNQANYATLQPTHSNFALYFYQKSSVGPITISGKFTNQNESDGVVYLATIHLLRSLTKMLWGKDPGAGAPPPVCRLDAYGDYMINNVPVVVQSFKIELPDGVDYIAVGNKVKTFGHTMVPTISTISLTLNTMYSRQEIKDFSVSSWLKGSLRNRGYL